MIDRAVAVGAISALVVYGVIEAAWLVSMRRFYAGQFASFTRDGKLRVRSVPAAILTYVVIAVALSLFVLAPAVADRAQRSRGGSKGSAALAAGLKGAALGAAIYGVYNGTNKATLPGYSWTLVAVDTAWGAASVGLTAAAFAWVAS